MFSRWEASKYLTYTKRVVHTCLSPLLPSSNISDLRTLSTLLKNLLNHSQAFTNTRLNQASTQTYLASGKESYHNGTITNSKLHSAHPPQIDHPSSPPKETPAHFPHTPNRRSPRPSHSRNPPPHPKPRLTQRPLPSPAHASPAGRGGDVIARDFASCGGRYAECAGVGGRCGGCLSGLRAQA
jgi:hypothetical protein